MAAQKSATYAPYLHATSVNAAAAYHIVRILIRHDAKIGATIDSADAAVCGRILIISRHQKLRHYSRFRFLLSSALPMRANDAAPEIAQIFRAEAKA